MENNIKIVPYSTAHDDELAAVLVEAFEFDKFFGEEFATTVAMRFIEGAGNYASFGFTAMLDGTPVGVILGHTNLDYDNMIKQYRSGKLAEDFVKGIDDELTRESIYKCYTIMFNSYANMYEGTDEKPTGYLALLALAKKCRGLRIGRALVEAFAETLRENGVSSYGVLTDKNCSYQFYEHLGLRRVNEESTEYDLPTSKFTLDELYYIGDVTEKT